MELIRRPPRAMLAEQEQQSVRGIDERVDALGDHRRAATERGGNELRGSDEQRGGDADVDRRAGLACHAIATQTAVRTVASRSAARFNVSYFLQKAKRTIERPCSRSA